MPNYYDPYGMGQLQDENGNVYDLSQNDSGGYQIPAGIQTFGGNGYGDSGGTEVPEPTPQTPYGPPPGKMQQGTNPDGSPRYVPSMPGYDAAHNPYGGSWQFNDPTSDWYWLPDKGQGRPANYAGGPPDMGGDEGTWGGPVSPFSGGDYPTFTPPPLPESLRNPYALPTAAELQATPGYMARYQQGFDARQRAAAARGTLLNGGTLKALDRYGQEYAGTAYGDAVQQGLQARNQAVSEYLNLAYGPAWQSNQAAVGKYQNLYGQYSDLINNNRNAQQDYWAQQKDLLAAGLQAAGAGNPGNPTT